MKVQMSDLRRVLNRVQTDYDFHLALLSNPKEALAPYSLRVSERHALTVDRLALWNLIVGGRGLEEPPRRNSRWESMFTGLITDPELGRG